MLLDDREDVLAAVAARPLLLGGDDQVRPEEGALEALGLAHPQLPDDVADDLARRRRGEREDRDVAEPRLEPCELPVRRAEVVAPVADAVRLVDDDQADPRRRERTTESVAESLGRGVDDVELAGPQLRDGRLPLLPRERRVEQRRAEAGAH